MSTFDTVLAVLFALAAAAYFSRILWSGWKAYVHLVTNPKAQARVIVNVLFIVSFGVAFGVIYWVIDLFGGLDEWDRVLSIFHPLLVAFAFVGAAIFIRSLFMEHLGQWAQERLHRKYGREVEVPPYEEVR